MIRIEDYGDGPYRVTLDGKVVGRIHRLSEGYQYRPKGHYIDIGRNRAFWGEVYPTLAACKASLA